MAIKKVAPKTKTKRSKGKKRPIAADNAARKEKIWIGVYYMIPLLMLALVFNYCATGSKDSTRGDVASNSSSRVSKKAGKSVADKGADSKAGIASSDTPRKEVKAVVKPVVIPKDVNNDLEPYLIAQGSANILASATTTQSGSTKLYSADKAIDGSIENNDSISAAKPAADSPAWWQAELSAPAEVSSVVIYGAGSACSQGKLLGGFEVAITDEAGATQTRRFNEGGYALEGYEAWALEAPIKLKSIKINSLNNKDAIVLREVQAIGAAQSEN